jgi:uncharacterized protein (TIGR02271 family)
VPTLIVEATERSLEVVRAMNTGYAIKEGMVVNTSDGQRLGKVIAVTSDGIQVEGGFLFPQGHRLLKSEVQDVRGDRVLLMRDLAWFRQRSEASAETFPREVYSKEANPKEISAKDVSAKEAFAREASAASADEIVSVPLMEEQLEVRRRPVDRGEVAIHKRVETVTRTMDVPLRHEVVHVERVSASDVKPDASYHAFEDQTFHVPLKSEEADVVKRAVYTGEVQIHKRMVEQPRHLSAQVRHEEIDLAGKGEIESDTAEELRRDLESSESARRAIKEPER